MDSFLCWLRATCVCTRVCGFFSSKCHVFSPTSWAPLLFSQSWALLRSDGQIHRRSVPKATFSPFKKEINCLYYYYCIYLKKKQKKHQGSYNYKNRLIFMELCPVYYRMMHMFKKNNAWFKKKNSSVYQNNSMTHLFYCHVICLGMHECQRIGFAPSVFTHHRVFLSDDMKDGGV